VWCEGITLPGWMGRHWTRALSLYIKVQRPWGKSTEGENPMAKKKATKTTKHLKKGKKLAATKTLGGVKYED